MTATPTIATPAPEAARSRAAATGSPATTSSRARWAMRECDDGNEVDGDGCSTACGLERCGNGRLDEGEACDDGNDVDSDGCTSAYCAEARCGDGILYRGVEDCDDANDSDTDACTTTCRGALRRRPRLGRARGLR